MSGITITLSLSEMAFDLSGLYSFSTGVSSFLRCSFGVRTNAAISRAAMRVKDRNFFNDMDKRDGVGGVERCRV